MIQDFISRGHINRDYKDKLKAIILSQHRCYSTIASTAIHGRKQTISDLYSSRYSHSHHRINSNHSFVENFGSAIFGRSHTVNQFKTQFKHEEALSLHDIKQEERVKLKFFSCKFLH